MQGRWQRHGLVDYQRGLGNSSLSSVIKEANTAGTGEPSGRISRTQRLSRIRMCDTSIEGHEGLRVFLVSY